MSVNAIVFLEPAIRTKPSVLFEIVEFDFPTFDALLDAKANDIELEGTVINSRKCTDGWGPRQITSRRRTSIKVEHIARMDECNWTFTEAK